MHIREGMRKARSWRAEWHVGGTNRESPAEIQDYGRAIPITPGCDHSHCVA